MYNINNHYNNIYSLASSIIAEPSVVYLYPFGSTSPEHIEVIGNTTTYPEDLDPTVMMFVVPGLYPRSGPILLCYDQEPLLSSFNKDLFDCVKNRCRWGDKQPGGNFEQPILLLNTEFDSDEKNRILLEHNFIDCYYFYHIFAAHDWFRGYRYHHDLVPAIDRTIKKKYITFNRITSNARVYRSLLLNELISNGIGDQGHISFSRSCPEGTNFDTELINNSVLFGIPQDLVNDTITNINDYSGVLRIDTPVDEHIENNSFHISAIKENMESFVHIVTETCYWGRKKHLTEKIFKPIVMRQPFILVGCAHNLEYLKSYGFKTFDKWWDESYDQIEDDIERMHAIGQLLANICKNNLTQLTQLLHDMNDVLEYNYRWFYSQEFIDNAWDELEANLVAALKSKPLPYTYLQMRPRPLGR